MRIILPALFSLGAALALPLTQAGSSNLDRRVREFLDRNRSNWHDLNVPEVDGRTLHDLVLKHKYTKALEIGTSTGHSGIWIAWALSKTGGRLITIDIDERRHKIALANFKEAGLSDYIDARLADAHELVPKLAGPFDFVFSDADKEVVQELLRRCLAEAGSRRLFHRTQRVGHAAGRHPRVPGPSRDRPERRDDDRSRQQRRAVHHL